MNNANASLIAAAPDALDKEAQEDLPLTFFNLAIALAVIAFAVWLSAVFPLGFGSQLP